MHWENHFGRVAFSLLGENRFYGTPLNAHAPDSVPGGHRADPLPVACGLVDFALGTDTGGSTRVPASNCGIWGFRPSHDFVIDRWRESTSAIIQHLGILAKNADVLARVGLVFSPPRDLFK